MSDLRPGIIGYSCIIVGLFAGVIVVTVIVIAMIGRDFGRSVTALAGAQAQEFAGRGAERPGFAPACQDLLGSLAAQRAVETGNHYPGGRDQRRRQQRAKSAE